jgi:cellulose synthase/poly-beta-1,6-N-acetylglucosamine synthase-like glycosyltransferase
MIFVLDILTIIVLFVLGIFSLRRLIFLSTALLRRIDWNLIVTTTFLPTVTVFIPCLNEETVIGATLDSLLKIDYPEEKLQIIVIDDGCTDKTLEIAKAYQNKYVNVQTIHRSRECSLGGKAASLNEAISKYKDGEILYFLDADHRPKTDALIRLIRHFSDENVGAVNGRSIPSNKHDALISTYVYIESLVHHRVTMFASDRLGLAPGILGSNFCIRRSLLQRIGGFNEESLTEDLDLTVSIYENDYIIRYEPTSITEHEAPNTIKNYILQHLRWNRGFNQVAQTHWRDILNSRKIPLFRRVELIVFSLGYLDRLFFALALCLSALSLFILPSFHFPLWVWPIFIGIPALGILTALFLDEQKLSVYLRLPLTLSMFSLDIFVALKGFYQDLRKKPRRWYKTLRIADTENR